MQDRAYFVHQPRRIEDLYGPRPLEAYTPYRVIGTVELSQMAAALCRAGPPVWDCVLVRQRRGSGGVLVVPDGPFVEWAALWVPL